MLGIAAGTDRNGKIPRSARAYILCTTNQAQKLLKFRRVSKVNRHYLGQARAIPHSISIKNYKAVSEDLRNGWD